MSFSLIGDVNANGLTPAKLDEVITGMLSEYVQKPEVTVIVTGVSIKRYGTRWLKQSYHNSTVPG